MSDGRYDGYFVGAWRGWGRRPPARNGSAPAVSGRVVPPSREHVETEVAAMLDPARFRGAEDRSAGRIRQRVDRAAQLETIRAWWEAAGVPWSEPAAAALTRGNRGPAIDHFRSVGAEPSTAALGLRFTPFGPADVVRDYSWQPT